MQKRSVNNVVEQMLRRLPQDSDGERSQAMRQVMQEIALAGLVRRGFFAKAAFYGGTCLRLFHQLPRFSEDLDFSLLQPDPGFRLQPYLQGLEEEFSGLGIDVQISEKQKTNHSPILSAFLKASTTIVQLTIPGAKSLRIKLEVDTDPPLGFSTEEQLLLQPYSCYVKCFSEPRLVRSGVVRAWWHPSASRSSGRACAPKRPLASGSAVHSQVTASPAG
ncbi:nucleotidyl transferase AbiEii/AbiGii toxin family protein [Synechococcus sp. CCY 0621]|uniref:nucleotidyl transferase AbiEii/AbiGii toxin family protein n=1 Tax=Synechococcus sp. CCY 0621 TaxID=2815603 RepID=UPI001C215EF9|nr:nucleotidyl transferase AbiEii/AbiGii toxin family protein [Synechococcus sp. CCY 0621]